jgi:hypothetical protein
VAIDFVVVNKVFAGLLWMQRVLCDKEHVSYDGPHEQSQELCASKIIHRDSTAAATWHCMLQRSLLAMTKSNSCTSCAA